MVSLGSGAFANCSRLTNAYLPASVQTLGSDVFEVCTSLQAITVDPANAAYASLGGVLFDHGLDSLLEFPAGRAGSYTVTNGVNNIAGYAFYQCHGLTNVILPASLTNLQSGAFASAGLSAVYFNGNSPVISNDVSVFGGDAATAYYQAGTTGWGTNFDGLSTAVFAPFGASWATPASVVYGTALSSAQLDASATVPGTYVYSPAAGTVPTTGTHTLSLTFTPASMAYPATNLTVQLGVQPAPLTVTASNATRVVGTTNPVFAGTLNGVVNSDNLTATFVTTATSNSPAGTYPITPVLSDPNQRLANYTVTTNVGTLTIVPTNYYTVNWVTPASVTYGTALGAGQLNAGASITGTYAYSPTAGTVLTAGTHSLSLTFTPNSGTYPVTNLTVSLVVQPAPLTVTANNASRMVGTTNPVFGGTLNGVVNNDNITASFGTTATSNSPVGTYPVTPVLSDPNQRLANYTVTTNVGTLTITPFLLVVNGGFETGDFTGWTRSGNLKDWQVSAQASYVHSGNYGAQMGPSGLPGYLSQTIPTISGSAYTLSFWLNSQGGAPNQFFANWNGNRVYFQTNLGITGWINIQVQVTAAGTNSTLQFGFQNNPAYFALDDISLALANRAQPRFTGLNLAGNQVILNVANGVSGGTYVLYASTNLAQGWTAVSTNTSASFGYFNLTVTNAAKLRPGTQFFYLKLE